MKILKVRRFFDEPQSVANLSHRSRRAEEFAGRSSSMSPARTLYDGGLVMSRVRPIIILRRAGPIAGCICAVYWAGGAAGTICLSRTFSQLRPAQHPAADSTYGRRMGLRRIYGAIRLRLWSISRRHKNRLDTQPSQKPRATGQRANCTPDFCGGSRGQGCPFHRAKHAPDDFIDILSLHNQWWCKAQNIAVGHCARNDALLKARRRQSGTDLGLGGKA